MLVRVRCKCASICNVYVWLNLTTALGKVPPPPNRLYDDMCGVECVLRTGRGGGCFSAWSLACENSFPFRGEKGEWKKTTTTFIQEVPSAHSGHSWGQELLPRAGNFPSERLERARTHTHTLKSNAPIQYLGKYVTHKKRECRWSL